jgi:hypothetical protein
MGQTTPNMNIYIPAAGETNYDQSFAAGMVNIDQHDHTGGPNKGVPISTGGIADGSITYQKLNANVVDTTTGIGTNVGPLANQIAAIGILKNLYQLSTATGFISKNGSAVQARTFQGTPNQIAITNPDGAAGNPIFSIPAPLLVPNNPSFQAYISTTQSLVTGDSTEYVVLWDTVNYDRAGNVMSPNIVSTVSTSYVVSGSILFGGLDPVLNSALYILLKATTGEIQVCIRIGNAPALSDGGQLVVSFAGQFYLPAGQSIDCRIRVAGTGKTVSLPGNPITNGPSIISGYALPS